MNLMRNRVPSWDDINDTDKFILLFKDHTRAFGKFVKDLFLYQKSLIYK